ncbi:MAG: SEC-C motif domain [Geobacteraceae bacterium]|nr:MAG: SEC-C motif domain [Geobacteraceae bacterium]
MKIGRNDPCPCGSGIKYKKCCDGKQEAGEQPSGTGEVMGELRELLKGQSFASLEDANAFLRHHMQQRSQAPIDDFHGLSSEQMHRFLHFPFEMPHLVTFPSRLDIAPEAPIMTLVNLLVDAIGEERLKATATGNLPRNFCREAALAFLGEEGYREKTRYCGINTEPDFPELHVARLVAELAGLVRKYKGKFILGRECRKLLAEQGPSGIYPRLFRAFAGEYNWGYRDRYPDFSIIQQSFLFTLYLLQRFGAEWRTSVFYADNFLRAFPAVLGEARPLSFETAEETVGRCYAIRALDRFAGFLGLAEIERDPAKRFSDEFRLRKLPLLEHVVQFHL